MVGIITRLMVEELFERGLARLGTHPSFEEKTVCSFGEFAIPIEDERAAEMAPPAFVREAGWQGAITALHETLEELRVDDPETYGRIDMYTTAHLFPETGVRIWYMPEGLPGRDVFISPDESGSYWNAIGVLLDGWREHLDVCFVHGPTLLVNENGIAEHMSPNRIVWATRHTHEAGYLSQMDFEHVVDEDELYVVLFGPIIAMNERYVEDEGDWDEMVVDPIADEEVAQVERYVTPGAEIVALMVRMGMEVPPRTTFVKSFAKRIYGI